MKGWVYIATMTNTLGVVKVGYSTNDPDERVKDWASATGAPGTAKVEYAVWVEGPEIIERKVHERLTNYREKNKEWFKCNLATAVAALETFGPFIHIEDRAAVRKDIAREKEEIARKKEVARKEAAKQNAISLKREEQERILAQEKQSKKLLQELYLLAENEGDRLDESRIQHFRIKELEIVLGLDIGESLLFAVQRVISPDIIGYGEPGFNRFLSIKRRGGDAYFGLLLHAYICRKLEQKEKRGLKFCRPKLSSNK